MMRTLAAVALIGYGACAHASTVPTLAPERYGHCFSIDGDASHYWSSTVFEQDIAFGRLQAERERFQAEFRALIESRGSLSASATVHCELNASRETVEQSKALKRNGFRFNRTEYTELAWAPSAVAPVAIPAVATAAPPADATVLAALAATTAFALPPGGGAPITRKGRSVSQPGTPYALDVDLSSTLVRQAGNVCTLSQQVQVGSTDPIINELTGLTWGGLFTLSSAARMTSNVSVVESQQLATAVSASGSPLFPLVSGNVASFTITYANTVGGTVIPPVSQLMDCTVGGRVAAADLVPGATGEAVELACGIRFSSLPDGEPRLQVFHWFSDAGCFVQDPTRD